MVTTTTLTISVYLNHPGTASLVTRELHAKLEREFPNPEAVRAAVQIAVPDAIEAVLIYTSKWEARKDNFVEAVKDVARKALAIARRHLAAVNIQPGDRSQFGQGGDQQPYLTERETRTFEDVVG